MKAGRMRYNVTIKRATITRGAAGGMVETWNNLLENIPCEVAYLSGREFRAANQIQAEQTIFFRFRYDDADGDGMLRTDKIEHRGILYDIVDMREIGRRNILEVRAKQNNKQGVQV
jgi:SPP1 family predicted phage head-tail adaptor